MYYFHGRNHYLHGVTITIVKSKM